MKRIRALIVALLIILTGCFFTSGVSPAYAQQSNKTTTVFLDEKPVTFDVSPVIKNGRTLVPFRAIAESLNVQVLWNGKTQTVTASDQSTSIHLQIGNKTAYRGNTPVQLDVPPLIINGRTLVPLRFFSEAFKCKVTWEAKTNSVHIISPPKTMTVLGFYALGDSKTSSWKNLFGVSYPDDATGNTDIMSEIALGWYSLDPDGNLTTKSTTGWQRPDGWETVLNTVYKYNLIPEMVVHVTDRNSTLSNMLNNSVSVNKAVSDIVYEARLYQGVNLDLEGLGWKETGDRLAKTRYNFTNFVQLLSQKLKQSHKTLTLTLHAPNSAYKGYDYKTLGQAADKIVVMAFEYGSTPEPDKLVTQAVEMAVKEVPREKLLLGIAAPNETSQSILTKIGIAKRYNLQGIALWRLGLVTQDMWSGLRDSVIARK